jgi:hypothetical protein
MDRRSAVFDSIGISLVRFHIFDIFNKIDRSPIAPAPGVAASPVARRRN